MWTITKRFDFSAAHHLNGLLPDHPCSRNHGHNYSVEIDLVTHQLQPVTGFVVDYRDLEVFKTWIDTTFDHKDLNVMVEQPSAECLAEIFYRQAASMFDCTRVRVSAVRVKETEKDLRGVPRDRRRRVGTRGVSAPHARGAAHVNPMASETALRKREPGTYVVNEIFYSIQGEGILAGTPMVFIRFSDCNLRCDGRRTHGFACDTEFMSGREAHDARADRWRDHQGARVTFAVRRHVPVGLLLTGGEPLLQVDDPVPRVLRLPRLEHRRSRPTARSSFPYDKDFGHAVAHE
jgi:6-pyruvoyltetrahydropterin/6-carboxytetrahydropterin synthase